MFHHHTKTKGDLAILKAQLDMYEKGFMILMPLTEHAPFDLVAYKENKFLRIQVKYRNMTDKGNLEVKFRSSYSTKNGVKSVEVDKSQIDYYCIFCPETDACYYLNPNDYNKSVTLRIKNSKNGQLQGVYFADNFRDLII